MTVRERYQAVLGLYRAHFWKFLAVNSPFAILLILSYGITYFITQVLRLGLSTSFPVSLLLVPFSLIVSAAAVIATSNAVLKRPVKIRASFRRAVSFPILARIFVSVLPLFLWEAFYVITFDSLHLSVTPGRVDYDYLGRAMLANLLVIANSVITITYSYLILFTPAVSILEKRKEIDTLKRAISLCFRNFGRVFVNYGLAFFIPFFVFCFLIGLCMMIPGMALLFSAPSIQAGSARFASFLYVFMTVFSILSSILVNPIANLFSILVYYDLRARQENYSEDLLAEEMGYETISQMISV
jgi:hypothetical protein